VSADPVPNGAEDPRADLRWGTVPALVADVAQRRGDTEAVIDGDTRTTWAQVAANAERFARACMAAGVEAGDRVAIWAPNCVEWVTAAFGALGAGAVLVPLNTRYKGAEAAYIVRTAEAKLLCTVRGFLGTDYPAMLADQDLGPLETVVVLRGAPTGEGSAKPRHVDLDAFLEAGEAVAQSAARARAAAVRPSDPSDLIFTSGTTGRPRGAVTTHAQSLRTFGTWSSIVGLTAEDRYLIVNPFFHTFGYKAGLLACAMTGATAVPEPVFDVDAVLRRIAAERVTVLPGPPTLYQSLLAHPERAAHDLSSLRLGVTGAAVVPVELVKAMKSELGFDTVLTAYGLTESCGTVTMCRRTDPAEVVATTSGRAIPDLEVAVVDPGGAQRPRGEPGEIVVRGYTVMQGYWNDPVATAEAVDAEGWLHTGDIGVMDPEGNVTITDRLKDMFVVGGFNAYPAEIETALRGFPGVAAVAVVGVPDGRLGEVGCAFVVRDADDAESDEAFCARLLEWGRNQMANFKAPRHAVVVDALPLNASGKVLKRELRERFA
jgi:HIP---CoA ligase